MPISSEEFYQKLKNNLGTKIKLTELFSSELEGGKLYLNKIDFYRLGTDLVNINFADCIISECDFSFVKIVDCDFRDCELKNNNIMEDTFIHHSVKGLSPTVINLEEEDWSHKTERFNQHKEKLWLNYPEDIIQYEKLSTDNEENGFFIISQPSRDRDITTLGWKIHLSVNKDDLKRAFNLVAPIISKYCHCFKVIDIDNFSSIEENQRFLHGAQITIYLEESFIPIMTVDKVKEMLEKVNLVLEKEKVRAGVSPISDAQSRWKYFSFRNDCFFLPKSFEDFLFSRNTNEEAHYVPAHLTGSNCNPAFPNNPYAELTQIGISEFNIVTHFTSFTPKNAAEILFATALTMTAYLRQYTNFESFDDEMMLAFKQDCFHFSITLDNKYIKAPYQNNMEIKRAVKMATTLLNWFHNSYINRNDNQLRFAIWYPYQDQLQHTLRCVDVALVQYFNLTDEDIVSSDNNSFHNTAIPFGVHLLRTWQNASENNLIETLTDLNSHEKANKLLKQFTHLDPFEIKWAMEFLSEYYLSELHNPQLYFDFLIEHKDIPECQVELATIYLEKYSLYGLTAPDKQKAVTFLINVTKSFNDPNPEYQSKLYCQLLVILATNPSELINRLTSMASDNHLLAQISLGVLMCRDLHTSRMIIKDIFQRSLEIDNDFLPPIDHTLAKELLSKATTHALFGFKLIAEIPLEILNKEQIKINIPELKK